MSLVSAQPSAMFAEVQRYIVDFAQVAHPDWLPWPSSAALDKNLPRGMRWPEMPLRHRQAMVAQALRLHGLDATQLLRAAGKYEEIIGALSNGLSLAGLLHLSDACLHRRAQSLVWVCVARLYAREIWRPKLELVHASLCKHWALSPLQLTAWVSGLQPWAGAWRFAPGESVHGFEVQAQHLQTWVGLLPVLGPRWLIHLARPYPVLQRFLRTRFAMQMTEESLFASPSESGDAWDWLVQHVQSLDAEQVPAFAHVITRMAALEQELGLT